MDRDTGRREEPFPQSDRHVNRKERNCRTDHSGNRERLYNEGGHSKRQPAACSRRRRGRGRRAEERDGREEHEGLSMEPSGSSQEDGKKRTPRNSLLGISEKRDCRKTIRRESELDFRESGEP